MLTWISSEFTDLNSRALMGKKWLLSTWYISGCRAYTLRGNSVLLFKGLQLITHTHGTAHGIILKAPRSFLNESNLSLPTASSTASCSAALPATVLLLKNLPHFLASLIHVPFWRVSDALFRDFIHNHLAASEEQKSYPIQENSTDGFRYTG